MPRVLSKKLFRRVNYSFEGLEPRLCLSGIYFSTHVISQNEIDGSAYLQLADMDGDGDADIVAASRGGRIAWFENANSGGTFGPPTTIGNQAEPFQSVFVGDIDHNGETDVLAVSDNTIVWYQNRGDGREFGPPIPIGHWGWGQLFASDLDSDGDIDVIRASDGYWFKNVDGAGNSWQGQTLGLFWGGIDCLADVDGDGDLDAVTSIGGAGAMAPVIFWHENTDAKGSFGDPHGIWTGGTAGMGI